MKKDYDGISLSSKNVDKNFFKQLLGDKKCKIFNYLVLFVDDTISFLEDAKSVCIKQVLELGSMIGCYEESRNYQIYSKSNNEQVFLYYAKEMNSNCCSRSCCKGGNRTLQLNLKHLTPNSDHSFEECLFSILKKEYDCNCWCCSDPEMICHYCIINGTTYGRIFVPFSPYKNIIQIKNRHGRIIYSILTDACLKNINCSCNYCFKSVDFSIMSGDWFEKNSNEKDYHDSNNIVGMISKKIRGVSNLMDEFENIEITFPQDATSEYKILLINAALMMDYIYF